MKRIVSLGIAAALAAVPLTAAAQVVTLGSQHAPGMCLQFQGDNVGTIGRCTNSDTDRAEFSGYGHFKIRGSCVTAVGENRQLVLRACNNSDPAQKWIVNPNDRPGAMRNEQNLCADIDRERRDASAPVIAYKCNSQSNQRWTLNRQQAQPQAQAQPQPQAAPPAAQAPRPTVDLRSLVAVSTGANTYDLYTSDKRNKVGTLDGANNITVSLPPNLVGNDGASMVAAGGGNIVLPNGQTIPMVAAGGGNMVAAGGGNMVAAGGGNMVAAGGGNMVAAGGGNIIAAGGGNVVPTAGGSIAINPGASANFVAAAAMHGNPRVNVQGGGGGGFRLASAATLNELRAGNSQQVASAQPSTSGQSASGRAIKSQHSNKCLDVPGGRYAAGNELAQADCNNQASQRFEFTSSGEIKIGGLCVDAYGGGGNAGDRIGLWQCTGAANQKWRMDGGQIKGVNNRCIDLVQGSTANGAKYVLWDCHGGPNQKFGS